MAIAVSGMLLDNARTETHQANKTRDVFYATGLKASSESINLINQTISGDAITALKNISGASVALSIQPIGRSWLEAAKSSGGDAIDLDPGNGSLIGMKAYFR